MNDRLIEISLYLATILLAAGIPLLYLRNTLRKRRNARVMLREMQELGVTEPVTLHPRIDPNLCIGAEACIKACPEGEILGEIGGKAALIAPTRCIGHGACAAACPVGAISLVFGTEQRGVDLPALKPNFETNVEGIYVAGELGGMGLIRNAVTQGREAIEYIDESLTGSARRTGGNASDVAIIGAGPAGLSASLAAMERGLSFVCLEQDDIGGSLLTYPRRKVVMTHPMDIPLYGRVKAREISKEDVLGLWHDILDRTGLTVHTGERVEEILKKNGLFAVKTGKGDYQARRILLAIGRRGTPKKLGVPGERSPKVAYRLIEPEQYRHSRLLVVGGGDSAVEAALAVSGEEGTEVAISHRGRSFTRIKERNRQLLEDAMREQRIRVQFDATLSEIREKEVILEVSGKSTTLENEYVLIFIGGTIPMEFLRRMGIEIRTKFGEA